MWRSSSTKRQRKDGELRLMRRESQTKEQALKIRSTHQEVFFVAVDSNLGTVVGEKEGAVTSIPGNEVEWPRLV